MRYLIQKYYTQKKELNRIHDKIIDSWKTLFHTAPLSDIQPYQTEVLIYGTNNDTFLSDKPPIILALVTLKELNPDQISRIENQTNSSLIDKGTWNDIDLTLENKPKKIYYSYEFLAKDITEPDIMESWLKD